MLFMVKLQHKILLLPTSIKWSPKKCNFAAEKMSSIHQAKWLNSLLRSLNGLHTNFQTAHFIQAGNGNCVALYKLTENDMNQFGHAHCGFTTALIDIVSSGGLLTHKDYPELTLTHKLNVSFVNTAKVGNELKIISNIANIGRNSILLDVEIINACSNELLVKADHTKLKL